MIKDMNGDMPTESFKNALQPQPSTSMFGTLSIYIYNCLEFLEEATYRLFEQSNLVPQKPSKLITYVPLIFTQQSRKSQRSKQKLGAFRKQHQNIVSPSCTKSCKHTKEHAKRTQIIVIITKDRQKANEDIEISCIYEALIHNNILFKNFKTFEHKLKT